MVTYLGYLQKRLMQTKDAYEYSPCQHVYAEFFKMTGMREVGYALKYLVSSMKTCKQEKAHGKKGRFCK